ncbi:DUF4360 domain-containing protein [Couchioplanes caeruleus]|uniref:DUF4360 domain-containing protein n=2 Tax=Couchioplanes caeruleus TaxID=56438 RepID=A0A1K0GWY7_9ACTN|nr:DUF4360 domain-containing protein [Couchioplanes caeruleus]OJF15916.1 hypothetical protein BG844_01390 [Couchioplanes caeruleus subsp. caeruleus]ROP28502.1 uncharacterized protein DUF4360 [Couchioplanes caeruleus]
MLGMRVIAALLLSASMMTPARMSAAGPSDDQVTIEKLTVNGTGCRADTVAVALSPDKEAFTVMYSSYLAQAGTGARNQDQRRTCSLTVRLNVPATMQYAITAVDYRGFAHLEAGASASLSARYHFQGSGAPTYTVHSFASGLDDMWQVTDSASGGLVFSSCGQGRKVDIDTELRVRADRADAPTSHITMDSTDSEVASTYHLTYRHC